MLPLVMLATACLALSLAFSDANQPSRHAPDQPSRRPDATDRTISGVVEDASGGAIPGARVSVTCGAEAREVAADGSGTFEVRGLPAAACQVVGVANLFSAATVEVDLSKRSSAYVRLVLLIAGLETEVIVTPSRGDQEQAFTVPEAVAVTTREELESRPHQILPQVLREEPGILMQQTTPAQGSPFIRGFSAQRIVYLLDGVRFNTSTFRAGATQYLGWINPALVQRLEVVRGPASVQYGSDALGGVIHVLSVKPPFSPTGTRVSGSIEAGAGSGDLSAAVDVNLLVQMPALAIRAGGSARRAGDLRSGRGRDSHSALARFLGLPSTTLYDRLPDTGFQQRGAYVAAAIRAGSHGTLNAIFLHEEQAGVHRYDRQLGGDGLYRSLFEPQRLDFAYLRYERGQLGPMNRLAATFSVNRQQDDRLEQARPGSRIERETSRVTALGYQTQAGRLVAERHALEFGGEVYDEFIGSSRLLEDPASGGTDAVRPEIPDGTRYTSAGLFLQDVTELMPGRISIRGGVRFGSFLFRTRRDQTLGVDEDRIAAAGATFHSGAVVSLNRWTNATFRISRGFRAANAFDLGAIGITGGGFELSPARAASLGGRIGTSDGADAVGTGRAVAPLTPESLYALEAGLKFRRERFSAAINVFDLELVDAIQRRTVIFPSGVAGTVVAGYEIVRQDEVGRAFVAADPRSIVTRANIDRARITGLEGDAQLRIGRALIVGGHFSVTNGRELGTDAYLRRMPPPLGGVRVKWEPPTRGVWVEATASFALAQTRLSPGDLADARMGARRSRSNIAGFFNGTATDLGLVRSGVLIATGETLAQVQARLLGGAHAAPMFTRTPGFVVLAARAGWHLGPRLDLTLAAENLADRNYRVHGSGFDAPGFSLHGRTRWRF